MNGVGRKGRAFLSVLVFCALCAVTGRTANAETMSGDPAILSGVDRQMYDLAVGTASRCAAAMQSWVAANETTMDKLFAFLYYPIDDTDPPKFHSDYDELSDRDISQIQEQTLQKSDKLKYVVLVDKNGYLPTHNKRYSQPLTGRKNYDLVNNRTKRIFNDRVGLLAARNRKAFLLQDYPRDTGEMMYDISVPVIIDGKHWGSLRFGYVR
jgi:hypothetical protein